MAEMGRRVMTNRYEMTIVAPSIAEGLICNPRIIRILSKARLALMNGNPITIGIGNERKTADRRLNMIRNKGNAGLLQIRNGLFKIVDFKRNRRAALSGWFPSVGYGECNLTDFILYPVFTRHAVQLVIEFSRRKPKDVFIEVSGTIDV